MKSKQKAEEYKNIKEQLINILNINSKTNPIDYLSKILQTEGNKSLLPVLRQFNKDDLIDIGLQTGIVNFK